MKNNKQNNTKQHGKIKQKNTNVRHLLNNLCSVAGEISDICKKSTSQGKLLNPQELKNLQVASEILRSTRESQLKAKLLKSQKEESQQSQPQLVQLDSASILEFIKQTNKIKVKEEAVDAEPA